MNEESWRDDLKRTIEHRLTQIICIVIDSVFLSLWVLTQYLVDRLVTILRLSGINQWALLAFQCIFVLSTLAVVLIFFYEDIAIIIIKTRRQIQQTKLQVQPEGNDHDNNEKK